jgi:conjugative transfer pilus assembly protein TraH
MFKKSIAHLLIVFLLAGSSHTGWIDDWASQATSQGPSSFEGQKRNYYSGGYFSARYHASKDYLFSVNAPSIKMGCGGIDIMMGGFSFLKADEMVKKMEKIITSPAAAAFAFDMALGILCEPCKNSLNEMEKFVNALKQHQPG